MLPSGADGRHIPERDEFLAQPGEEEFVEDRTRRWVSIGVCGTLSLLAGIYTATALSHGWMAVNVLATQLMVLGGVVLLFGAFVAYLTYPAAIGWAALAGVLIIVESALLFDLGGSWPQWLPVGGLIALGAVLTGLGAWRAVVSWNEDRREDEGPVAA